MSDKRRRLSPKDMFWLLKPIDEQTWAFKCCVFGYKTKRHVCFSSRFASKLIAAVLDFKAKMHKWVLMYSILNVINTKYCIPALLFTCCCCCSSLAFLPAGVALCYCVVLGLNLLCCSLVQIINGISCVNGGVYMRAVTESCVWSHCQTYRLCLFLQEVFDGQILKLLSLMICLDNSSILKLLTLLFCCMCFR